MSGCVYPELLQHKVYHATHCFSFMLSTCVMLQHCLLLILTPAKLTQVFGVYCDRCICRTTYLGFGRQRTTKSLLKTTMSSGGAELPFPIKCNTDECIVIKRSATIPEASITCTVEVKRHVVKQSLRQALTQFVCASLKSNLPGISTLTDMTTVGVAFYTTGEKTPNTKRLDNHHTTLFCNSKRHDAVPCDSYGQHSARCSTYRHQRQL